MGNARTRITGQVKSCDLRVPQARREAGEKLRDFSRLRGQCKTIGENLGGLSIKVLIDAVGTVV